MLSALIMGEQYILPEAFVGSPGGGAHVRVVAEYEGSPGVVPEALYDPTRTYCYWDDDVYCVTGGEAEGCTPLAQAAPSEADAPDEDIPDTSIPAPTKLSEYEVRLLWDSYIELRKAGRPEFIHDLVADYRELRGY